MDDEKHDDGVCSSESFDGGTDVRSCNLSQSSSPSSSDHLVVMVNGILGSTGDWKFASDQFVRKYPDAVIVHCSEKNVAKQTLDGIDVMGDRLVEEVVEVIEQNPNIRKISFIAHSLGGLVARYAIGRLYRSAEEDSHDSMGTILGLEPMNFITVATPHLGSRGNKQVPFLFGVPAFEKLAVHVVHWIFGRTGRHLFLTDEDDQSGPLLRRMVEDCSECGCHFMSALQSFRRRVAYSNVVYDNIVGWQTSSIRRHNELPELDYACNGMSDYPHVVREEYCKAVDCECEENGRVQTDVIDELNEEMLLRLSQLPWEKVDVSFHTSNQRFSAHSIIQVKNEMVHSEGADVVCHIVDHFAL